VRWLSDAAVDHLREVADRPDLGGTAYELGEPVGRGGMGTVYRARDRRLERDVALKVMNAPAPAPAEVERMRREAQILARLEHPGIVPVHDLGVLPGGRLFYVMKLVRGRRLDEAVEGEPLPGRLRKFERICEAVAFAHVQGVVHRDLKPENVMVGPFGEVLVLDWGVAKLLEGAGRAADSQGTVLGTPGYMSPEQARGETEGIDGRTDVYGLGAILRFLIAGEAGAPARLAAVAARAMAGDPALRYASVGELSAEVRRYLDGGPVEAYPEGPLERALRLASKYRTPLILIAAYLVARVLLAVLARV
jgi:serine/threonine protein kinase